MTHGRTAKTRANRRSKKSTTPLTGVSENPENSLESRVARLEGRIEELQEAIDRASGVMPAQFYEATHPTPKTRPGPDEQMDESELSNRRDAIVKWIEEKWPDMVKPLLAARSPREVAVVLRDVAGARENRSEWLSRFVGHPAKLWDFLQSKRFRKKPPKKTVLDALSLVDSEKRRRATNRLPTRQIANAMAGVPKLEWRTSLDKCSRNPSSARVGYNTEVHYRTQFRVTEEQTRIATLDKP